MLSHWGYVPQFSFCFIHLRLGAKDVSPQETMAVTNSKFLSKGLFLAKEIRSEQPKRTEKFQTVIAFLLPKTASIFFFFNFLNQGTTSAYVVRAVWEA